MTTENKELGKVVGGPEDNTGGAAPESTDSNKNEQAQKKFSTSSGKEFDTPEELQAYTSTLEEELVRKAFATNQVQVQAPQPTAQPSWEEEVAESMFTDPVGTLKKVREKVSQEIKAEEDKKNAAKAFWNDFYKENPDLQNAERIVNLTSKELAQDPEFGRLPAAQVKKRLAAEVRMAIKDIAKGGETETVINGKPAPAFSGSNPIQKAPNAPAKPKSFVDQFKEFRAKKRA
jgi:hypothetical protein